MSALSYTRRDFIKTVGLTTASLAVSEGLGAFSKPAIAAGQDTILHDMGFRGPKDGWDWPEKLEPDFEQIYEGLLFLASGKKDVSLRGRGVHTRNGDTIEFYFSPADVWIVNPSGSFEVGFAGGFEFATAKLDFKTNQISFSTSDCTQPQPVAKTSFKLAKYNVHRLRIKKTQGAGALVKKANIEVSLDLKKLISL